MSERLDSVLVPKCSSCGGSGWLGYKVPLGNPRHGDLFRCQCVADRDTAEMAARRLAASNLPHAETPQTFDDIRVDNETAQAIEAAKSFCQPDSYVRCLTFTGDWGTRKTLLLEAIGRAFLEAGKTVRYEVCADLLKDCRATISPTSDAEFHEVWDRYLECDLLILDQLGGMDNPTPWGTGILYSLVDERYRNEKHLAVATNMPMRQVARAMDEGVADRLWDASTGRSEVVTLTGPSNRTGEKWSGRTSS